MSRNLIQRLREKSKDAKNSIALGAAGTFTAFVFVVWVTTSTGQFGEVVDGSKQGAGAFSSFFSQVKDQFDTTLETLPDKEEIQQAASSTLQEQIDNQARTQPESGTSTDTATSESEKPRAIRIATTSSNKASVSASSSDQVVD